MHVLVCSNGTYMSLSEQEYVCKYQAGPEQLEEDTVAGRTEVED